MTELPPAPTRRQRTQAAKARLLTLKRAVHAVMSDGQWRTSATIAALVLGRPATPPEWWRVSTAIDALAVLVLVGPKGLYTSKPRPGWDIRTGGPRWLFRRLPAEPPADENG